MTKTPYSQTFRIGSPKRKLEVQVVIHGSRKAMMRESTYRKPIVAFVKCFNDGKIAAVAHFNKTDLDKGTIAHEAVHVASGLLSRLGFIRLPMRFTSGQASNSEETFACYVGQITFAIHEVVRMGRFRYRKC